MPPLRVCRARYVTEPVSGEASPPAEITFPDGGGARSDSPEAARRLGLTRARVTQIVNLTLLAPAIQEPILDLPPVTSGRDRITERTLRPIVTEPAWERQMVRWRSICSHGES